LPPEIPLNI